MGAELKMSPPVHLFDTQHSVLWGNCHLMPLWVLQKKKNCFGLGGTLGRSGPVLTCGVTFKIFDLQGNSSFQLIFQTRQVRVVVCPNQFEGVEVPGSLLQGFP